jgi:hypothetical protein
VMKLDGSHCGDNCSARFLLPRNSGPLLQARTGLTPKLFPDGH